MSTELNKELVRRYYEEIVSEIRIDDLPSFISSDYVEVYRSQRHASGLEGAKRHILGVHETYRGLRIVVEHQIAEGDWVVSQITARGTHVGPWMGMKPTGKAVEFTGVNLDKVVDGLIVEHGGAANMLEPLLEIGAIQVVG